MYYKVSLAVQSEQTILCLKPVLKPVKKDGEEPPAEKPVEKVKKPEPIVEKKPEGN